MKRNIDLYRELRPAPPRGPRIAVVLTALAAAAVLLLVQQTVMTRQSIETRRAELAWLQ
jgi:hypothetical protein